MDCEKWIFQADSMTGSERIVALYKEFIGAEPAIVSPVPGSGSNRLYVRLGNGAETLIGAFNEDVKENRAFISFSRSFLAQGLPVPSILVVSSDEYCYLLSDLGDTTLFGLLQETRGNSGSFPAELVPVYQEVLEWLPKFQVAAKPEYGLCYPRAAFDRQSMLWDLNYFKYYYLKLAGVSFDEQHLENDFNAFSSFLLGAPSGYFMYRDFQSRNVMIYKGHTWFIDYQGGRQGALQYDLVSLLYDAKADIPDETRQVLLDFYLDSLSGLITYDRSQFLKYYPAFVLVRILQAMGAYGFRGYYEKKQHFLQSIPYALKNLDTIRHLPFLNDFPELKRVIDRMIESPLPAGINAGVAATQGGISVPDSASEFRGAGLAVSIQSFAYKNGYPQDVSGNGGGFVFDCRALPNPGRYEQYTQLTGMDQPVIDFLKSEPAVDTFLHGVFQLVDQSVAEYQRRNFTNLAVSFGCTGGQHRSVYCAEILAEHFRQKFNIRVALSHREQK